MALKKKGSKRRVVTIDFEGVESGGKIVPDGTYNAVINSIEQKESSNDNDMWVVKWKLLSGKGKGGLVWDNLSLTPQALWRVKGLLEALEIEVPDSSMDIDLAELEGQECSIQVTNETYEGKDRPRVTGYGSAGEGEEDDDADKDEDEDDDDEDEKVGKKPAASKKKASKKKKDEEEEDDGDEDDDADKDEDEDDEDEDEKPVSKKKTSAKAKKSKFKEGQRVSFKDEDGKTIKGVILEIDGDTVKVEDKGGDEWEIDASEVTAL